MQIPTEDAASLPSCGVRISSVAQQFGADHAEILGSYAKVIVPVSELACSKNYFDRSGSGTAYAGKPVSLGTDPTDPSFWEPRVVRGVGSVDSACTLASTS